MKESEKSDFLKLLADVMAYYRQDLSTFAMQVWWDAFQHFDFDQVSRALSKHATDPDRGQFAPKVADLVRVLSGTSTDRAAIAWGKALDAAQRVGAYTDVVFDDAAIHAAIEDLGGWPKFCRSETKELSYLQHRFCEAHRAYVGRESFDFPKVLGGDRSSDDMYALKGLKPPRPAVIGDTEKAKLVFLSGQTGGGKNILFSADLNINKFQNLTN